MNAPDTPVAVVTGANRGIGRAITVALAAAGFAVAAGARDPASLADTVKEAGETVVPVACDVCDEGSVATLAEQAGQLGPVRVVVANAGIPGPTAPLHEITLADWRETIVTNLDGVFLTFRAFIPAMIEHRDGSLIAISSMTGKRPLHGRTPYAAAKMGVIGLVRTLAAELGPHGIRVNAHPSAAAFAVPAAACGRTAKAASPIRQMRPNAIEPGPPLG